LTCSSPAPAETKREFYAELPVTLNSTAVTTTWGSLRAYRTAIAHLTLNDIGLTAAKDGSLSMDVTAKTFRYLDDEEVAAQNRGDKGR